MPEENSRSLLIFRKYSVILAIVGIVSLTFWQPITAPLSIVECSPAASPSAPRDALPTAVDSTTKSNRGGEPCLSVLDTIQQRQGCFIHNRTNCPSSSGPLYNYAYYGGQGFGRLIEHSIAHCLTAAALSRPCIIDINPRDEHYTWRSFMNLNSKYAVEASELWDRGIETEVNDAISRLKGRSAGHWTKNDDHPVERRYMHVLPMVKDEKTPLEDQISLWEGSHPVHGKKALLSPNWGTAWFPKAVVHLNISGVTRAGPKKTAWTDAVEQICDRDRLVTLIQNEVYRPGQLALRYHRNEKRRIFKDSDTTTYGAVHLRTFFFLKKRNDVTLADLILDLDTCLTSVPSVKSWWLVMDNPVLSQNVTSALNNNPNHPRRIRYGYDDSNITAHPHSKSNAATSAMGHLAMAPSILDWTVIHESDVAVVSGGAYGQTAARGRGKVLRPKNRTECMWFKVWEQK